MRRPRNTLAKLLQLDQQSDAGLDTLVDHVVADAGPQTCTVRSTAARGDAVTLSKTHEIPGSHQGRSVDIRGTLQNKTDAPRPASAVRTLATTPSHETGPLTAENLLSVLHELIPRVINQNPQVGSGPAHIENDREFAFHIAAWGIVVGHQHELLTIAEVSAITGSGRNMLLKWIANGRLKSVDFSRPNGRTGYRVSRVSLFEFLGSCS